MNFVDDLNKLLVCKTCGYTEEEYESNSIEFNIKMAMYISSISKAKAKIPAMPKPKKK